MTAVQRDTTTHWQNVFRIEEEGQQVAAANEEHGGAGCRLKILCHRHGRGARFGRLSPSHRRVGCVLCGFACVVALLLVFSFLHNKLFLSDCGHGLSFVSSAAVVADFVVLL